MRSGSIAWGIAGCCLVFLACGEPNTSSPLDAGFAPTDLRSGIHVTSVDSDEPTGCKITVRGRRDTRSPVWAHEIGVWLSQSAFAVENVVFARDCDVRVPLRSGEYEIIVSRGISWEPDVRTVSVDDTTPDLAVSLERVPRSDRWACIDLHVHAAPSFDSMVPMEQRLVSAVAEGLDGIVASDHDVVADWDLAVANAGVAERLLVVTGNESTPDKWSEPTRIGHVGAFPVPPEFDPESVMPLGAGMPELLDMVRASAPDALLQLNHPRWNVHIGWFDAEMWETGALTDHLSAIGRFDALEVWNGHELTAREEGSSRDQVLRDWYSLLNAGLPLVATGNSDSHGLAFDAVGYPRTCLPFDADRDLRGEDVLEALRAGTPVFTSGPLLDVTVEGSGPGELTEADGSVIVDVEVASAQYVDVDFASIIVNGDEAEQIPLPDESLATVSTEVALSRDSWVVVGVEGDEAIGTVAGPREHPLRSAAFTNPVYVDFDGDGMWTAPGGR